MSVHDCLVGALLALASGKAERRQVHPPGRISCARSFCEFCEFCGRIRLLGWCSWDSCTPWEGGVGMAGMPYPPTKTPTDCTDVHRLGAKTQPKNL